MNFKSVVTAIFVLIICCSCNRNRSCIIVAVETVELYNTLKSNNEYKRKSIAYSATNAYGLNRMTYHKCVSDSIRTDICYIFYYVGTESEIEKIKADLYSTPKMYNTLIYWDKNNEFAKLNNIMPLDIAFIAFITDKYNDIMAVANPTIVDFSSTSLDKLQNEWENEE